MNGGSDEVRSGKEPVLDVKEDTNPAKQDEKQAITMGIAEVTDMVSQFLVQEKKVALAVDKAKDGAATGDGRRRSRIQGGWAAPKKTAGSQPAKPAPRKSSSERGDCLYTCSPACIICAGAPSSPGCSGDTEP